MRDPRETHWAFSASFYGDVPDDDALFWRMQARVNELKSTVRVLSLTQDDDRTRLMQDEVFGRGFSHPRLWEQYADNHAGVCLVLDKRRLLDAVLTAASSKGTLEHGPVAYRDGAIEAAASGVDLQAISQQGIDQVLTHHLERHVRELFFTKLEDWASEEEFRFVLRWDDDDELYVNVEDALRGVIVGHAVAKEYAPALEALCAPMKVQLAKIQWMNGRPIPVPF
jgi:hypothetical protein